MSAAPEDVIQVEDGTRPHVGEARRRASRENGKKGRGPRDCAETKRNAYAHGMTARIAFPPEELRLIALRAAAYQDSFRPQTPFQFDMCEEAATGFHRAKRAQIFLAKARQRLQDRSRAEFDRDRRLAARTLAQTLAKRPERVAAELRGSVAGCDYLIERWKTLAAALATNGRWAEAQTAEAYDLLGATEADRLGDVFLPVGKPEILIRVPFAQIEELERLKSAELEAREARQYEESREGMGLEEEPEIKLYRRYEREAWRHVKWAIAELLADQDREEPAPADDGPEPVEGEVPADPPGPSPEEPRPSPVVESVRHDIDEASAPAGTPEPRAVLDSPQAPSTEPTNPAGPPIGAGPPHDVRT